MTILVLLHPSTYSLLTSHPPSFSPYTPDKLLQSPFVDPIPRRVWVRLRSSTTHPTIVKGEQVGEGTGWVVVCLYSLKVTPSPHDTEDQEGPRVL